MYITPFPYKKNLLLTFFVSIDPKPPYINLHVYSFIYMYDILQSIYMNFVNSKHYIIFLKTKKVNWAKDGWIDPLYFY